MEIYKRIYRYNLMLCHGKTAYPMQMLMDNFGLTYNQVVQIREEVRNDK